MRTCQSSRREGRRRLADEAMAVLRNPKPMIEDRPGKVRSEYRRTYCVRWAFFYEGAI